ncbi:hypothetical protein ACWJJH_21580 [Endozoicomonadaceae bacterium StTr2]
MLLTKHMLPLFLLYSLTLNSITEASLEGVGSPFSQWSDSVDNDHFYDALEPEECDQINNYITSIGSSSCDKSKKALGNALRSFLSGKLEPHDLIHIFVQSHLPFQYTYGTCSKNTLSGGLKDLFNDRVYLNSVFENPPACFQEWKSTPPTENLEDWIRQVMCQLGPECIRYAAPDLCPKLISTCPVADDAPLNLIWVGTVLPKIYLNTPIDLAQANPGREIVLWYYSDSLNYSDKRLMSLLVERSDYKQYGVKVLDLAKVDESRLFPSFNKSTSRVFPFKQVLQHLLPPDSFNPREALMAADFCRHFLMAAGSDLIDQLEVSFQGKRTSSGMVYVDLDGPDCMVLRDIYSSETTPFLPMTSQPLSYFLCHSLPAGIAAFHTASNNNSQIDHIFLAVNERENPIYIKCILEQAKLLLSYDRNLYEQCPRANLEPATFAFYPFLQVLQDMLPCFVSDLLYAHDAWILSYCAGFYADMVRNNTTVARGGKMVNVDLTPVQKFDL